LLDTPKHIRLSAVQEACKNLKTCFSNKKTGNISSFNLGFKTKKQERLNGWSLGLEKNSIIKKSDELCIFSRKLGVMKYARKKQLHKLIPENKPLFDSRIQKDRFGDYFLLVPIEKTLKKPPKVHTSVKSYDPGVNIYLTGYDPSGHALFIGKGCDKKILYLLEKLDLLISRKTVSKGRAQEKIKKKIITLRKKIHYLKTELHNQTNNIVAKSSSLVLYPKLNTKDLSIKEGRQLTTKTVRKMLNLGHCSAYEKLILKCKEHGTKLLTVSEAYTTKTCPCCGRLNTCSNERIYTCDCNYKAERDLNGALNILLRSLES
jgi:transposase